MYVNRILASAIAIGAGAAVNGDPAPKTYQLNGITTTGTGAVSVNVEGSNNGVSFDVIGVISLTLSTTLASDSFQSRDTYNQVRGNVISISGTGAAVNLTMGA